MKHGTNGYRKGCRCSTCSKATRKYKQNWRLTHLDSEKIRQRKWRRENRERLNVYRQKWRRSRPELERLQQIKCKYGLTKEVYENLLAKQRNRCVLCREIFQTRPHVDHCHTTKRVRGLLCKNCNLELGKVERYFWDTGLHARVLEYLGCQSIL